MSAGRARLVNLFVLVLLVYGALQVYVVMRLRAGLGLHALGTTLLGTWATGMTIMPLAIRRWEQGGRHRTALAGAWIGYTWMGVTFLFSWISGTLQLTAIALPHAAAGAVFLLSWAATAALAAYGFAAARRPRIDRVTIDTAKLPRGDAGLRVALISDVHLGALVGKRRLGAVLEQLRALNPDVLVSAGDLLDGQCDELDDMAAMLAGFTPPGGKYAVTGNHEYFVGLGAALAFHERAGFRVLRGEASTVDARITLAGVDDPTGVRLGAPAHVDEAALLSVCPPDRFTVLVKHQPRIDERVDGRFDLQVSGHVHKGQIFPFGWVVRLFYPWGTGLRRTARGAWLYVSRGTGTWGPPMRIGAPAEITLIEIVPSGDGDAASPDGGPASVDQ